MKREQVAKRREAQAGRERERYAAVRELPTIPPPADMARRTAAAADLRVFCDTYLHETFYLPWSPAHLRVLALLQAAMVNGGNLAIAMPRGCGKTAMVRAAALWSILTGLHSYLAVMAATDPLAHDMLDAVKYQLRWNKLLAADWPEAVLPLQALQGEARRCGGQTYLGVSTSVQWTSDRVVMPTIPGSLSAGAVLQSMGITAAVRGLQHTTQALEVIRPSLILIDDPQTNESARNPLTVADRYDLISGAIAGLAGPRRKPTIVVPCTLIYQGDLADQLTDRVRSPGWHGIRIPLLEGEPEHPRMWDRYFDLVDAANAADDTLDAAAQYYLDRREQMDAGVTPMWPAKYYPNTAACEHSAIQHAMNLRHANESTFLCEYQQAPPARVALSTAVPWPEREQDIQAWMDAHCRPDVERGNRPAGACFATGGIDINPSLGATWSVWAWAAGGECWLVEWGCERVGTPAVMLASAAARVLGVGVDTLALDASGTLSETVREVCMATRGAVPVVGVARQLELLRRSVDPKGRTLLTVRSGQVKHELARADSEPEAVRAPSDPAVAEVVAQLLGEVWEPARMKWIERGPNHWLDTRVLAWTAARAHGIGLARVSPPARVSAPRAPAPGITKAVRAAWPGYGK